MSATTNAGSRQARTRDKSRIVEVRAVEDFGPEVMAPDGVTRRLLSANTVYEIHAIVPLPRLLPPEVTSPGTLEIIQFIGKVAPSILTVDGDDTPRIWGRDVGAFSFQQLTFVDVSNAGNGRGSVLFDLVGGNGQLSFLLQSEVQNILFKEIARLVDVSMFLGELASDTACAAGWVARLTAASAAAGTSHVIGPRRFSGSPVAPANTGPALVFQGVTTSVTVIGCGVALANAANSFLHIDSGTPQGAYAIANQNYIGGAAGAFFRPDEVAAITAQDPAALVITSFVDSTANPGVDTTVDFGAVVDFTRGQVVLISGEAAYDGTHEIVRVASDQMSFDIAVVHSTSGAGTLEMVEHAVASCKYARDETIAVAGSTNYNDAAINILRKTPTSFTLPQVFSVNDATGTATSTGRDQTSLGVLATANGAQESSKVGGEACWNGNASTTTPQDGAAAGVYVPLILTGVGFGGQRMTLSDAASGEMTYNGESPATLTYTANIVGVKAAGGTDSYRVTESVNGAVPVFDAEPAFSSLVLRVASVGVRTLLIRTVPVNPGDTIRPVIIGDGTTTSVIVTEGQILVSV